MSGPNTRGNEGWPYGAGVAVAALGSLLTVWVTIVRDDGSGIGSFMLILAIGVGAFAAGFRAAGMARTLVGVTAMQAATAALVATAPVTSSLQGGVARSLIFNAVFAALWLASAALFAVAARRRATT